MPKYLRDGEQYAGRSRGQKVLNLAIDREADAVLRLYAGDGIRPIARFVERLIWEYHGKMQERQRRNAEQNALDVGPGEHVQ